MLLDAGTGEPVLPNGTLASRYSEAGKGRWNLDLGGTDPVLTLHGRHEEAVPSTCPASTRAERGRRRDPPRRAGDPGRRQAGDHGVRPAAGAVRRGPRRAAGNVAVRLRRRGVARHAGLAGGDHLRACGCRGPDSAGIRPQRGTVPRPVDDRDGGRDQPLVPFRPDLPHVLHAHHAVRLPGRERRRLGALRGAGEGAAVDRVPAGRVRAGLAAPAAAHDRHVVLLPAHRPVAL